MKDKATRPFAKKSTPRCQTMHDTLLTADTDSWSLVSDVDGFMDKLYKYYVHRGWKAIIAYTIQLVIHLLVTTFTLFFLIFHVDWKGISDCRENSCRYLNVLASSRAFSGWSVVYGVIVFGGTLLYSSRLVCTLWEYGQIRSVFHDMKMRDSDLNILEWDDVALALVELNRRKRLFLDELSVEDLRSIVMRKENIMIALVGADIVPMFLLTPVTRLLISSVVIDPLFDPISKRLRSVSPAAIVKQARIASVLVILSWPILVPCVCIHAILRHATELRAKNLTELGERTFTYGCLYRYRMIDEMDHEARARLRMARPFAKGYLEGFPSHMGRMFNDAVYFLSSAAMVLLLTVSFANEDVLIFSRWTGAPLWWWLAISTVLASMTTARDREPPSTQEIRHSLQQLCIHMRKYPPSWSIVSASTAQNIRGTYVTQATEMLRNISMIVIFPILSYARAHIVIPRVIEFVSSHTRAPAEGSRIGAVCSMRTDRSLENIVEVSEEPTNRLEKQFPDEMIDAFIETHMSEQSSTPESLLLSDSCEFSQNTSPSSS